MGENEFIVDRIEGNIVVVENNNSIIQINRIYINGEVKEGDVLVKSNEVYEVDYNKTNLRKEKINAMIKGLWKE